MRGLIRHAAEMSLSGRISGEGLARRPLLPYRQGMAQRWMVVAGTMALGALASAVLALGCDGEIIIVGADQLDGGRDGGADAREPTRPPPRPNGDAPSPICPSPASAEVPPYRTARERRQDCRAGIGAYIEQYIDATATATFKSLEEAIASDAAVGGQACARCIFSNENNATWGPIVYRGDGSTGDAFFNYGACFERAPGGSAACGKVVQAVEACFADVCSPEDCATENAVSRCIEETLQDTEKGCGRFDAAAGCGNALDQLNSTCSTPIAVIEVMCEDRPDGG